MVGVAGRCRALEHRGTRCGCACMVACVIVVVELLGSSCPSQRLQMANFPFRISTWDMDDGIGLREGLARDICPIQPQADRTWVPSVCSCSRMLRRLGSKISRWAQDYSHRAMLNGASYLVRMAARQRISGCVQVAGGRLSPCPEGGWDRSHVTWPRVASSDHRGIWETS